MCGRFVQLPLQFPKQCPWPALAGDLLALTAKYNLAPTQRAAVVLDAAGNLKTAKLRFGLIPPWAKDMKLAYSTINARVETVATKPAFRAAFKAPRRCLIPMQGYYEWREEGGGKQPYFIQPQHGAMLYAGGLWEPRHALQAEDEDGSFAIITHDAQEIASEVHDRMPIFLDPALADAWMRAAPDDAMAMLLAAPLPALRITKVDRRVNNSRYQGGPETLAALPE